MDPYQYPRLVATAQKQRRGYFLVKFLAVGIALFLLSPILVGSLWELVYRDKVIHLVEQHLEKELGFHLSDFGLSFEIEDRAFRLWSESGNLRVLLNEDEIAKQPYKLFFGPFHFDYENASVKWGWLFAETPMWSPWNEKWGRLAEEKQATYKAQSIYQLLFNYDLLQHTTFSVPEEKNKTIDESTEAQWTDLLLNADTTFHYSAQKGFYDSIKSSFQVGAWQAHFRDTRFEADEISKFSIKFKPWSFSSELRLIGDYEEKHGFSLKTHLQEDSVSVLQWKSPLFKLGHFAFDGKIIPDLSTDTTNLTCSIDFNPLSAGMLQRYIGIPYGYMPTQLQGTVRLSSLKADFLKTLLKTIAKPQYPKEQLNSDVSALAALFFEKKPTLQIEKLNLGFANGAHIALDLSLSAGTPKLDRSANITLNHAFAAIKDTLSGDITLETDRRTIGMIVQDALQDRADLRYRHPFNWKVLGDFVSDLENKGWVQAALFGEQFKMAVSVANGHLQIYQKPVTQEDWDGFMNDLHTKWFNVFYPELSHPATPLLEGNVPDRPTATAPAVTPTPLPAPSGNMPITPPSTAPVPTPTHSNPAQSSR